MYNLKAVTECTKVKMTMSLNMIAGNQEKIVELSLAEMFPNLHLPCLEQSRDRFQSLELPSSLFKGNQTLNPYNIPFWAAAPSLVETLVIQNAFQLAQNVVH